MTEQRKRTPRDSSPKMLAIRMEQAHADGREMDLDYDEVTGVIDCALERQRAKQDEGISAVRALIDRLNAQKPQTA